jgi:hypothetical protein
MSGIKLLATQIMEKKPEEYAKFHNPSHAHPKDFHALKRTITVQSDVLVRLDSGDYAARAEIRQILAEEGVQGTFIIQRPLGGLGRRGIWETEADWRAKRKSGMPEICRITVD